MNDGIGSRSVRRFCPQQLRSSIDLQSIRGRVVPPLHRRKEERSRGACDDGFDKDPALRLKSLLALQVCVDSDQT